MGKHFLTFSVFEPIENTGFPFPPFPLSPSAYTRFSPLNRHRTCRNRRKVSKTQEVKKPIPNNDRKREICQNQKPLSKIPDHQTPGPRQGSVRYVTSGEHPREQFARKHREILEKTARRPSRTPRKTSKTSHSYLGIMHRTAKYSGKQPLFRSRGNRRKIGKGI